MTIMERINRRTIKAGEDECWMWTGSTRGSSSDPTLQYPSVGVMTPKGGRQRYAHRVVYCDTHGIELGSIRGKSVRHTCDITRCLNPNHLLLGTHQDNMQDKMYRGRQPVGVFTGNAKMNPEKVRNIRLLAACGVTYDVIGIKYGICKQTVSQIVRRITWKHVD